MADNGEGKQLLQIPHSEKIVKSSSSQPSQLVEETTRFDGSSGDYGVPVKTNGHGSAAQQIEQSDMHTPQYRGGPYAGGGSAFQQSRVTERKRGHRRVTEDGQVTYKKKPMSELMSAIQLGIGQSIGSLTPKPMRDVLYEDFHVVETVVFPGEGSSTTPAHHYSDFRFKTFAPVAFRYFRELFNIKAEDFLFSLCIEPLQELSNPGASGSIFYITNDDEFIIKTVQHKEADFLQKLLPGYYMNLNQNPCTLLPKFYGLYCYQCSGKNIRFVVMNNLLPSYVALNEKYDLKGSTYKRRASRKERAKATPTLKDLDFVELNPDGILLEQDTYSALVRTIDRDCRVLQSFKIMDYSLLVGVHKVEKSTNILEMDYCTGLTPSENNEIASGRRKSLRPRVAIYTTAIESIQAANDIPDTAYRGGIPAVNGRGEQLSLYVGIIDILQSYRFTKKLEHAFKSMVLDGDTISVHQPGFYAQRFQNFFAERVFRVRLIQGKRKSVGGRKKSIVPADTELKSDFPPSSDSQRPDVLPHPTPPRPLSLSVSLQDNVHRIDYEQKPQHLYTRHEGYPRYKQSTEAVSQFSVSAGSLATSTASHTGVATSFTSSSPSKLSIDSNETDEAPAAAATAVVSAPVTVDEREITAADGASKTVTLPRPVGALAPPSGTVGASDTLPIPVEIYDDESNRDSLVLYIAQVNESTKL